MNAKYEAIIGMEHHVSSRHERMARLDRAAQFAPFAALTGYDDVIRETGRITKKRMMLDEDMKALLDMRLSQAMESHVPVTVTWFVQDGRKEGGEYVSLTSPVAGVDAARGELRMECGSRIPLADVVDIVASSLSGDPPAAGQEDGPDVTSS